jgi:uncharacterized protein
MAGLELPPSLFAPYPEIAVVYLFGSQARGEARPDSDLDLALVYRDRRRSSEVHDRIAAHLAVEAAKATGIDRVDVIDLEAQGPIFCHRVLLEGRRIHVADEARRVDFESDALVRAFDFRPTYELATRGKVAAMRRWLREHRDG